MAAWGVALVVGQFMLLSLIDAGPFVRYQHLPVFSRMWTEHPATVAFLASYWLAVFSGVVKLGVRSFTKLSRGKLALVALAALGASAALSSWLVGYATESVFLFIGQLAAAANAGLVAAHVPPAMAESLGAQGDRIFGREKLDDDPGTGLWSFAPAVAVVVVAALLAYFSYDRHPHIPDEVAYLLQAKYFAAGRLWMDVPPVPAAFEIDLMAMESSRWFSAMPPGWPAVLALGVLVGVPWLVNPLLAGLNIVLLYRLLSGLYDQRTARIATALLALSPWHTFLAMSFMSHTFSLTLALIAGLGITRWWKTGSVWWCAGSGAAIGLLSVNRPLEGAAFAVLLGVTTVLLARPGRIVALVTLVLGTASTGSLALWYNFRMTGHPLTFPVEEYFRRQYGAGRYEIGFGPTRGLGWPGLDPLPGHGFLDVGINALLNTFQLNTELLGWATGAVGLIALSLIVRRPRGADLAMVATIAAVIGVHSFFWFSGGPDFGARYWFLTIVPLLVLVAHALRWLEGDNAARRGRLLAGVVALSAGAVLTFYPWRATDKYRNYRGMSPPRVSMPHDSTRHLLLVNGKRFPAWASAAVYNEAKVTNARVVFAWDRDAATRAQLISAYPGRVLWQLRAAGLSTARGWQLTGPYPDVRAIPAAIDSSTGNSSQGSVQ